MRLDLKKLAGPALRHRKLMVRAAIVLLAAAAVSIVVLPPVLKSVLVKNFSESLHRDVSIGRVWVNPFMLSATVKDVAVRERGTGRTFASFEELYVNLQLMSLVKRGVVVKEVRLVRPYLSVVRNADLSYNFSDLLQGKKTEPRSKPLRFSVSNIQISGGKVEFDDGPKKTRHAMTDMELRVPFVSNLDYYADTFVQPYFSANLNGKPILLEGKTKIFSDSLETRFDIDVQNLSIPYYLAYVPSGLNFKVTSGRLNVKAGLYYRQFKKGRPPEVELTGDVVLKDFGVADAGGSPVLGLPRLAVSITSTELVSRSAKLAGITVDSPTLHVVRESSGAINLLDLARVGGPAEKRLAGKAGEKPEKPFSLDINLVQLKAGTVTFEDRVVKGPFRAVLRPVDASVINFSNGEGWKNSVLISLATDAGETVSYKGSFTLNPMMADGNVEVRKVPIRRYSPYYADMLDFDVADGVLGVSTGFGYSAAAGSPEQRLKSLNVSVLSLRLSRPDGPGEKGEFVRAASLSLGGGEVDVLKREAVLGSVSADEAFVKVERLKDGSFDFQKLVRPSGAARTKKEEPAGKGWDVTVKSARIASCGARFVDRTPETPVTVELGRINADAEDISTVKNSKGRVAISLTLNRRGSVSAKGTVQITPAWTTADIRVKDVEVTPFQGYFADKVRMLATDGRVSSKGGLTFAYSPQGGIKARFRGDVSVDDLAVVDKINADDFLKWKSLYVGGIDAGQDKGKGFVSVAEVALTDFYSRVIINADGTVNLQEIQVKGPAAAPETAPPPAAAAPEAKGAPPAYSARVGRITLQGGRVNFTDRKIKPNYSADITGIAGRVTGLTSEEAKTADVDLKCMFNNAAPLEITGRINPLRKDPYVDLRMKFTNMDLSPLTPYAGKYAGYTIQKGKLSFDLQYLIDNKKLDARNVLFLDQFTFGEKVESPDATRLPVRLAVALLKDRRGEIHLDLPVTGRTDDPKFKTGKIIWQVILNILSKAATSPFALLGSLFGGGEELGYMEFDYGGATISEAGTKKLDTLAKAMADRPALKLTVEGHVDVDADREGLRKYIFEKKIKAQKLMAMVDEGLPPVPVDEVKVEPAEYAKYLKLAYKAEKFPKPRNIIGIAKSLPPAEMEKLMLTHIEVTDSDLRQLAGARAAGVRDYMTGRGKVEPERVFVAEPKTLAPEKKEGLKDSRAVFVLG